MTPQPQDRPTAACTCARLSGDPGSYPCPVHPEAGAATFAGPVVRTDPAAATPSRRRPRHWRFLDWTARWGHVAAQVQWEPRDLWIGAFWQFHRWHAGITGSDGAGTYSARPWSLHVYVCVVPLVPIHVYIERMVRP